MIKQLEALLKKAKVSKNKDDVRGCLKMTLAVLDYPEICQVKNFIDEQLVEIEDQLCIIEQDGLRDYNQIEKDGKDIWYS